MKAIILSAGQGRRLLPLTTTRPKSSLLAGDQSLLAWQLQALRSTPVTEVVVVTGFGARYLDDIAAGVRNPATRTSYNPFYEHCDNLGTCWTMREEMHEPFLLINGDTLFESAIVSRLLANSSAFPITLATDHKASYDDDDMKVISSGDRLEQVGKRLDATAVNGESIGMMVFRDEGPALFRRKLEQLMRKESGRSRWYLSAVDELAHLGQVGLHDVAGLDWCEVDDAPDLASAADMVRHWDCSNPIAATA